MIRALLLTLAAGIGFCQSAAATLITATVTADNHYGLYFGTETNLTFVGRNETGPTGNPGNYNWSLPETFADLDLSDEDRFFIVQWDEGIGDDATQGLLAEFTFSSGATLRTNASQWQFYITSTANPGTYGDPPKADALETMLASSFWTAPGFSTPNGTNVWAQVSFGNPVPGISTEANWISQAELNDPSFYFAVYRSPPIGMIQPPAIPEPTMLSLFALGLAGLGWAQCRRPRGG